MNRDELLRILDLARLAPSVHNVQPWKFHVDDNGISLFVATERMLDSGDPTRRELWVSMGICLESLLQSGKGLGFVPEVHELQTRDFTQKIARITFSASGSHDQAIIDALRSRHSYRKTMAHATISEQAQQLLEKNIADIPEVSLVFSHDPVVMEATARAAEKGMRLALSSNEFRTELAGILHTNLSRAQTGLHGYVMNHGLLGSIWQKLSIILGVDAKRQATEDYTRIKEASLLVFITAKGDVPKFWLSVGRAYLRIALDLTKEGFVHSTITAPIEAGRFHEDIEKLLGTSDRIQSLLRVGAPTHPQKKHAPRLSVNELLT